MAASACSELSSKTSQSSSLWGSTVTRVAFATLETARTWTAVWSGNEMHSANCWETYNGFRKYKQYKEKALANNLKAEKKWEREREEEVYLNCGGGSRGGAGPSDEPELAGARAKLECEDVRASGGLQGLD